jgi:hypothetical protein
MFHLFRTYIAANVLCCKCFISRCGKGAQAKVLPSGAVVPACAAASAEHKAVSMGVAAAAEHEAASMG